MDATGSVKSRHKSHALPVYTEKRERTGNPSLGAGTLEPNVIGIGSVTIDEQPVGGG